MVPLSEICRFFESYAPSTLSEEWDNVGLLVGDSARTVGRVMTCLTVTPASCAEAISRQANLIVTHHPLPFKPLRRLTNETTAGKMLLDLVRAGVAVYSPHTAFDSAAAGINQQLAEGIGLWNIAPIVPSTAAGAENLGAGRRGKFPQPVPLREIASRLKSFLKIGGLHMVGPNEALISTAALACGSGSSFLEHAVAQNIDLLITGEASFHTCLEAEASCVHLLLAGHYPSERFAVERLASVLAAEFPPLTVWASEQETDPLRWTS